MIEVRKFYNYPAHAVRVFERVVREQAALGRSLQSLTKGSFIGTGVSLRFEFAESPSTADYRLACFYGRRRAESDVAFQGWRFAYVLPMKCQWITIGYFYVLKRDHETVA